ncbi:MAG: hypothetical protein LRZ85_08755 [Alphaproteobacteria bacterium]|nr:hypothetical protein [Alphaproteobacteria bacterium]MCD8570161.1 hypothetical protein [Alphaproteobacteria bacterium]
MSERTITSNPQLSTIFGKFVGREFRADEAKKLADDLRDAASQAGISTFRVWTPGMIGDARSNLARLNVYVDSDNAGNVLLKDEYDYG